jgi:hypothetical protein
VTAGATWARGISPDAENREKDDFYATPPEGTRALLRVEEFIGTIWEPACGDGGISRELELAGHNVISTDLVDRSYGQPRVDFLMEWERRADNIVTNPPFKMALEFAKHALALSDRKVALLCRLAWLEGVERRTFFEASPLARIWVFSNRITTLRGNQPLPNSGMIAFAWFVWEHGHKGPPTLGWITA